MVAQFPCCDDLHTIPPFTEIVMGGICSTISVVVQQLSLASTARAVPMARPARHVVATRSMADGEEARILDPDTGKWTHPPTLRHVLNLPRETSAGNDPTCTLRMPFHTRLYGYHATQHSESNVHKPRRENTHSRRVSSVSDTPAPHRPRLGIPPHQFTAYHDQLTHRC